MRLRRQAPDPLYLQLKDSLLAEIVSGRYRSNQRLPSERELSTRFKVSRMTVRQASARARPRWDNLYAYRQRHVCGRTQD